MAQGLCQAQVQGTAVTIKMMTDNIRINRPQMQALHVQNYVSMPAVSADEEAAQQSISGPWFRSGGVLRTSAPRKEAFIFSKALETLLPDIGKKLRSCLPVHTQVRFRSMK